jgi:menaquinone-dependent protoporphyrinogen oxidase
MKILLAYGTKKGSTREVAEEIAKLPVAVFGIGPEVARVRRSRRRPEAGRPESQQGTRAPAVSVAIFGGVIDPAKLHFPFNRLPASDARDWDAIRAWAEELPATLGQVGLARVGH